MIQIDLSVWAPIIVPALLLWCTWVTVEIFKAKQTRHDMDELRKNMSLFLSNELTVLKSLIPKDKDL